MNLTYFKMRIWKVINCTTGKHWDKNGTANFCGACGKQINPDAYSDYLVTLQDGTEKTVTAVSPTHAQSLVIYGDKLSFDCSTGKPIGDRVVHTDNVKSVKKI
ncbi:hypothetical protein HUO09_17340 [Vibrio sp. Y2-5]|uniref:hypothetical protein n=1 Tax=Vibrio sp. Y2-5 TaxID=2743977 RepID=UPI001660CB35|nr:hypothetical protein [Vibrio sp. Y2-5]MBD0788121.1 hypothetical protein [Vibrio sp. Y2-5]